MFKTLKMIVKYSRMKKEDDKRRRRYFKLSQEELKALPDDALFDALTARAEAKLIKAGGFIDGIDSLSDAEKVFYIASYYEMEVNNGGLCQFFVNSSRMLAPRLPDCLREIGADEHAKLFETFVADNGMTLMSCPRLLSTATRNTKHGVRAILLMTLTTSFMSLTRSLICSRRMQGNISRSSDPAAEK